MSAKGCSPDNAAAEGFFGRLKQEFFHKRSFRGVTIDEFTAMLDEYMCVLSSWGLRFVQCFSAV